MKIELPVEHRVTAGYQFGNQWVDATGRVLTWQEITEALNGRPRADAERNELRLLRAERKAATDAKRAWVAYSVYPKPETFAQAQEACAVRDKLSDAVDFHQAAHPEVTADA